MRLEARGNGPAQVCTITPAAPLRLGIFWFYFAYRWVRFALVWSLLWLGIVALVRRWWEPAIVALGNRLRWLGVGGLRFTSALVQRSRLATRTVGSRLARLNVLWPRLSPAQAIWLVAAASVVLSCYPVLFFGKSFTSTNFTDGTFQLYDGFPTTPGTSDSQMETGHGADLGPMAWQDGPYSIIQHRALFRDGELPLWNRYDEGGVALLGQGQSMFGDPLHFLVIAADGRAWAWDAKFILAKSLFAAGVGLLVLAATDCLPAALLLSFSAAFIGFFNYRLNHPAYFSLCYSPWILYTWIKIVRAPTWRQAMRWAGGLILANWTELNSGTAKEAYMLLAGLNGSGVLMLVLSRLPAAAKRDRFLGLAVAGVIFCLLASPVLLAFFDTLRRSGQGYETPMAYQLQPSLLIGFFDDIFYRQFNHDEKLLDPSLNGLLLLGVLLAFGSARRLLANRLFAATALSTLLPLALVFGVVPPGVVRRVPFLANIYHVDNTFSCVLFILCFVLAGFGLKQCLTGSARSWRRDALLALAGGILMLGAYFGSLDIVQRSDIAFRPAQDIILSPFFRLYVPTVLLAAVVLPFVLRRLRRDGPQWVTVLLLAGCLVALHWRFGLQLHTAWSRYTPVLPDRLDLLARSPAIDRMLADRSGPFRACGIAAVLAPGYGAMTDIETIRGVDAIWNKDVNALDVAAQHISGARYSDTAYQDHLRAQKPFHDMLGIRYYLTMPAVKLVDLPGVALDAALDLNVYRNERAWPRAFFVNRLGLYHDVDEFARQVVSGDGRPFASIEHRQVLDAAPGGIGLFPADQNGRTVVPASHYRLTNHRTAFDVTAPEPGVLVLMEPYVEGDLVAELNGRRTPVWRVDHAFRGMLIDHPGTYHVVVTYVPQGFTLALWASALGLALALGAVWWLCRDGKKRPPSDAPPALPLPPAGARPG